MNSKPHNWGCLKIKENQVTRLVVALWNLVWQSALGTYGE